MHNFETLADLDSRSDKFDIQKKCTSIDRSKKCYLLKEVRKGSGVIEMKAEKIIPIFRTQINCT